MFCRDKPDIKKKKNVKNFYRNTFLQQDKDKNWRLKKRIQDNFIQNCILYINMHFFSTVWICLTTWFYDPTSSVWTVKWLKQGCLRISSCARALKLRCSKMQVQHKASKVKSMASRSLITLVPHYEKAHLSKSKLSEYLG